MKAGRKTRAGRWLACRWHGAPVRSIQFRLSVWLAATILATALAAGGFSYYSAFREAIEFQDNQLRQVAALVRRHDLPAPGQHRWEAVPATDADARLIVQRLAAAPAAAEENRLAVPADLPEGMHTMAIDGAEWRLFVRALDDDSRIVVGQQTDERDEVAHDSAVRTLMPFVVLIPLLLLLVGNLIRKLFLPVRSIAAQLDARHEQDLIAIDGAGLPAEILPFIVAINRLLLRVDLSVTLQRRFIADAAHELRSPMTALSLQTERLMQAPMTDAVRERVVTLDSGVRRTRALLVQLLALAHAQESSTAPLALLPLWPVLRDVMEELMPLAELRNIDIGVTSSSDALVAATQIDLQMLLRNLVENAIRYAPPGGLVNLAVRTAGAHVVVSIEDDGPGIPAAQRERVFDPFYRIPGSVADGSGLGLSIVKTIAARLGASVRLGQRQGMPAPPGLLVEVEFPRLVSTTA